MIAALLSSSAVAQQSNDPGAFDDDDGSVHEPALDTLAGLGVTAGTECAQRQICATKSITRETAAVWLTRAASPQQPESAAAVRFTDVDPESAWAANIERLAELGVTVGCLQSPLSFCPTDTVTRGQMASFLVRAFQLPDASAPAGFADTSGSTHAAAIDALYAAGVTVGCQQQPLLYCPADTVNRGQMASFLTRAMSFNSGTGNGGTSAAGDPGEEADGGTVGPGGTGADDGSTGDDGTGDGSTNDGTGDGNGGDGTGDGNGVEGSGGDGTGDGTGDGNGGDGTGDGTGDGDGNGVEGSGVDEGYGGLGGSNGAGTNGGGNPGGSSGGSSGGSNPGGSSGAGTQPENDNGDAQTDDNNGNGDAQTDDNNGNGDTQTDDNNGNGDTQTENNNDNGNGNGNGNTQTENNNDNGNGNTQTENNNDNGNGNTQTDDDDDDDPDAVKSSVTLHNNARHTVTEGSAATFKITASPAPENSLTVRITVSQSGSVAGAGQLGTRTVTISAGSTSATLSVSTVNDSTDESNGRITATLLGGQGYTTGTPSSDSVVITDDDDPPPAVKSSLTISASTSSVTEGQVVTFRVTANPRPRITLTVWFSVTDSHSCTATSQSGRRGVYLYGSSSSATLTVHTINDSTYEPDCTVTASIASGTDYAIGSPSTASATVRDNDPKPTKPIVRASSGADIVEGGTASFTISASPSPDSSMTVRYRIQDQGGVTSGGGGYGSVTIPAGGSSASVSVSTVDDSTDQEADDTRRPSRHVTLIIQSSSAYDRHVARSAQVNVRDND